MLAKNIAINSSLEPICDYLSEYLIKKNKNTVPPTFQYALVLTTPTIRLPHLVTPPLSFNAPHHRQRSNAIDYCPKQFTITAHHLKSHRTNQYPKAWRAQNHWGEFGSIYQMNP